MERPATPDQEQEPPESGRAVEYLKNVATEQELPTERLLPANISRLARLNELGRYHAEQGNHDQAESAFKQVLQGYSKAWGSEHRLVIDADHNLGSIYADQGRYEEAEDHFQRALLGYEKALGRGHASTLSVINNLSLLYAHQGRYVEAASMCDRALQCSQENSEPNILSNLATTHNLGLISKHQGKHKEAEALFDQAFKGYEKACGPGHTLTLSAANNLGLLYKDQDRYTEAETMFNQVLRGFERKWGPKHPLTVSTASNLALVYVIQRRYTEFGAMTNRASRDSEKVPDLENDPGRKHFPSMRDLVQPESSVAHPLQSLAPVAEEKDGQDTSDELSLYSSTLSSLDGIFDVASASEPTAPTAPNSQKALTEYSVDFGTRAGLGLHLSDFAAELFDALRMDTLDTEARAATASLLPSLLKHYAMMIGYGERTQAHRDIMVLVYRYRSRIVGQFASLNTSSAQVVLGDSTEMLAPMERLQRWMQGLNVEDTQDSGVANERHVMDRTDDIAVSTVASTVSSVDEDLVEHGEGDDDGQGDEIPFSYELLRSSSHQTLAINSEPFQWLVSSLRRTLQTRNSNTSSLTAIRQTITEQLEVPRTISKRRSSEPFEASYTVQWDLARFLKEQLIEHEPVKALSRIITITGTSQDAQALTSEQYLSQTWPIFGSQLLRHLEGLLASDDAEGVSTTLSDGTRLTSRFQDEGLSLKVHGTGAAVLDIGEQLAWLGAALRASTDSQALSYCVPSIQVIEGDFPQRSSFQISFKMEEIESHQRIVNGRCWHGLFKNPTVVKGYPITDKDESKTGIEIPLRIMAGLVGSQQIDTFNDRNFIKGFSKMLVPVKRVAETVYWHLCCSQSDETRISYAHRTTPQIERIDNSRLQESRHILGWSLEAEFFAGSSQASYNVGNSFLDSPDLNSILAGIHMAPASYINGGPEFVICRKDSDISLTVGRVGHRKRLKWISKEMILLWDTAEKRGWLINGLSALLHLVRASLENDRTDPFRSSFLFKPEHLQGADKLTADSAGPVLLNSNNLKVKVYDQEDEDEDEEETFGDRVKLFYNILEKLIDCQKLVAGDNGANLIGRPRQFLEGWDFHDLVVKSDDRFYSRITSLEPAGSSWVDLVRLLSAVTLFGRGFGDIIRPAAGMSACSNWKVLPSGKSYIATCLSDIRHWINTTEAVPHTRLGRRLVWHTETHLFEVCTCENSSTHECVEPVQSLLPCSLSHSIAERKTGIPLNLESGAVIFGQHSKSTLTWDEENTPLTDDLMRQRGARANPKTLSDSGIGSSIRSVSRESMSQLTEPLSLSRTWSLDGLDSLYTPEQTRERDSYSIGIICALSRELKAVRALLDQTFPRPVKMPNDDNVYELGRMGQHLVVAACLPANSYGTNAAAACAGDMRRSFQKIDFCFLVGVGGGVPSATNDIRLGDVVVGRGTQHCPAVIQYDLGKETDDGEFERTGSLANPPMHVLNAINHLQSDPSPQPDPLRVYMKEIVTRTSDEDAARYQYPGADNDTLLEPTGSGDGTREMMRVPRPSDSPVIHYGPIASGNRVIKSARFRDALAEKYGILCFEMEAAGVVNSLPTLVVRGICDYSDAQKSKIWQDYAAANAAAYVKLLLSVMPGRGSG